MVWSGTWGIAVAGFLLGLYSWSVLEAPLSLIGAILGAASSRSASSGGFSWSRGGPTSGGRGRNRSCSIGCSRGSPGRRERWDPDRRGAGGGAMTDWPPAWMVRWQRLLDRAKERWSAEEPTVRGA
jgi:hypothetical protein